ncbi:hypothetical protein K432DRAFT_380337 [Lepidopterella palustris CBS 459.81]|uniref:AA1-like domain-containing protein n=1 Tax=Lepidopterella palustris CBS 459.81 TaxID=1314670 RepID=A0A8E2JHU4_9PEZI|nr:hypothetical protein K432DRAFT_380337 [Lepidopterella palustris CBS 459.81]
MNNRLSILLVLSLTVLSIASPTRRESSLRYIVTDFGAFDAKPYLGVQSFISFHFKDPNNGTQIEGDCLRSLNDGDSLYTDYFIACGASPFAFKYQKGTMILRRDWQNDP